MMRHEHLPALKRYTSQVQYDALKSIEDTKSIKDLVFSGNSNRTLGVLVRSAWINTFPYVDDGVKYEGWCVTDAGKHAMAMFEEQLKIDQIREEKVKVQIEKYSGLLVIEYKMELTHRPELKRLDLERQKLMEELNEATRERSRSEYGLSYEEKYRGMEMAKQYFKDKQVNRS
jgi:hypothetical protein